MASNSRSVLLHHSEARRTVEMREALNGINYILKNSGQFVERAQYPQEVLGTFVNGE